ncbi:hypothetical protein KP79_PYT26168 [Mizuhopecten yessoensis]|uniref:P2X purinoceptor 7 n=2 Tax=Mizuhopecten yessoensis TaxID=6573 RepID=A0A210QFR2_MIZYE|nr:hypothetical protein KP79_PYT26168 [Mizuhopecten yessoensis]
MSDTDSDVPEVGGELDILPYQFEPARKHVDRVTEEMYSSQSETDESDDGDDHARARDIRTDNIAWCDCECCTAMTTETECLCCQEIDLICTKTEEKGIMCITNHEGFIANCLNRDVLEVSLLEFVEHDGPIDDNEPINE